MRQIDVTKRIMQELSKQDLSIQELKQRMGAAEDDLQLENTLRVLISRLRLGKTAGVPKGMTITTVKIEDRPKQRGGPRLRYHLVEPYG